MRLSILIFLTILASQVACEKNDKTPMNSDSDKLTYLALGDSYTIGEGVDEAERYPNQTIALLEQGNIEFGKPQIIARTGWTTDELAKGIVDANIKGQTFDLVTLLIGVNNQYRGRPIANYAEEFEGLLKQAIEFAGGDANHVVVLSIPDWGVTPFALDRDTDQGKVALEIDNFNKTKTEITKRLGAHYIDITEEYRKNGGEKNMVVSDKLHPSRLIYKSWADKLVHVISEKINLD